MPVWLYIVTLMVGTGLAIWRGYFPAVKHFRERLTSNKSYRDARAKDLYNPRIVRLYEDWLDHALGILRTLMGAPWSPQAFGICLILGLLYSSLFLIISWGFFGARALVGQMPLLPEWSAPGRLVSVGLLFMLCCVIHLLRQDWLADRRKAIETGAFLVAIAAMQAIATIVAGTIGGVAGTIGGTLSAVPSALAITQFVAVNVAVALTVNIALGKATYVAVTVAVGIVVISGLSVLSLPVKSNPFAQTFFLFWAVLPVVNAFWDWMSWWVSRWLGEHLLKTIRNPELDLVRKAWFGLWHATLDLAVALAFLALLARTLPWAVGEFGSWAGGLGGETSSKFADYLCAAAKAPWSTGLWATLMLLSTLVPTALHATATLASVLAAAALWLQRDQRLAIQLETTEVGSVAFEAAVDNAAAHLAWTWIAVWILAVSLATGAFVGLLWLGNMVAGELPAPLPGSLREALLGVALWDFEEAETCIAAPASEV